MDKILFIDRDGTIINEPEDEQIDSLEKLSFLPSAISVLKKIKEENNYIFVMVTNQDGLGTNSFPENDFWPAHNKMLSILKNENVIFDNILIDKSFEHENLPTRKPGIAMLTEYTNGDYDLENSYVIGDRNSDLLLAKNLNCKSIYIGENKNDNATFNAGNWDDIYAFLKTGPRTATVQRNTNETKVDVNINLDGHGKNEINTGIGFFDHMLEQVARHGSINLNINVKGDLHIDEHHTIEDTAIALGEAFYIALGDKKGIHRYGFCLPMDDVLARVAIDFSGRPWCVWEVEFKREKIGEMPTEMFFHFFKSFSDSSRSNLNINATGDNEHHKIESIFKAFAKAIRFAKSKDINNIDMLPSTKGLL